MPDAIRTAGEVPEKNKKRAVATSKTLKRKRKAGVSKAKACKILEDGKINGKPLTDKQRGMFGAICNE